MENDFTSTDLFEQYLDGVLSMEQQLSFESKLANDPKVASAFEFYKKILNGLAYADQEDLQKKIQSVNINLEQQGFFLNEDIIGDYLEGQLDAITLAKVNNKIANDEAFAKKVDFEKKLLKGIAHTDQEALLKNIGNIQAKLAKEDFFNDPTKRDSSVVKKEAKVIPLWKRYQAIAAAAAVLIGVGLFWMYSQEQDYTQVYANNFKQELNYLDPLLNELATDGLVDQEKDRKKSLYPALELYENKNYSQSITALKNHLETFPSDSDAQLYLGIGYLHQNNFREAIRHLKPLTENITNETQPIANWYLALAYLMTDGQKQKGKTLLESIANSNSPFQQQAKISLEQMH